jgi:SAM-dependent methyltransferase
MSAARHKSDYHCYPQWLEPLITAISLRTRKRIFDSLMRLAQPTITTRVIDVGVTSDQRGDCNFFEKFYPYPAQITAVGTQDAAILEQKFKIQKFVQADGTNLPFADKSFDLAVSFATLEHVGNRERQALFVKELCRVGKIVGIAIPNRWYPFEFHTILPFVHWLPAEWYRTVARWLNKKFFCQECNLNLLSKNEFRQFLPLQVKCRVVRFRLFGPVSNFLFFIEHI